VRLLAASPLALALLVAPAARAQGHDAAAAETLFRQARAQMEAGAPERACPKLAESLRLDFAAGTLLNLAVCEEQTGRLASAWGHFSELLDVLPDADERRPIAKMHLHELDRRMPRLAVLPAPSPGIRVTRDAVELRAASFGVALPVDPGEHTVAVSAPGRAARVYRVKLAQGENRALVVEPGVPMDDDSGAKKTAGWIVGGAGAVAIGLGAYAGMRDARSSAPVAGASVAVGVVALAVGAALVATSPRVQW
jgi:hypothetical protein